MDKEDVNKIDDAISDCVQEIDNICSNKNINISTEGLQEAIEELVYNIIE